jgi:hypothetical protein
MSADRESLFASAESMRKVCADKVGDYLLDCRVNGLEPDEDRIAEIALAVFTPQRRPAPKIHEGNKHPHHHCLVCGTGESPGAGCSNCRQTGYDQTPCSVCRDGTDD